MLQDSKHVELQSSLTYLRRFQSETRIAILGFKWEKDSRKGLCLRKIKWMDTWVHIGMHAAYFKK